MIDITVMPKWYVLYTTARREKKIVADINLDSSFEGYIPLKKVFKKRSDRVKRVEEPIFLNYVFVKTTEKNRIKLFGIPGVLRFVSFEGKPIIINDIEIEKIRMIEKNGENVELENSNLIGRSVVIAKGIFAGLQGMLIKKLNNCRLVIKIPLLRQTISVSIDEGEVLYV
jgi:transcription antitermination factor NusG